jgi:hypothetical protein
VLDNELRRSISLEQDLVVLTMKYTDQALFDTFVEKVKDFFIFRNLIFEWKDQGLMVIIRNMNIEEGLREAEQFYGSCDFDRKFTGKIGIGLTSRAGREADAERLILEAEQALSRALSDPNSNIIAFKISPEKYEAYIASLQK